MQQYRRWIVNPRMSVGLATGLYFLAIPFLHGAGNGYFTIVSLLPVITASLQLGRRKGLLAALIFTPVNFIAVQVVEGSVDSMLAPGGVLGTLSLFGTAWLVGYLQELANRRLVMIVEEKDRFIGAISHELRTPLSTVVGLSHELTNRLDAFTNEEVVEFTGMIAQQSSELEALIEDLLIAARADIERVHVRAAAVDLKAVVDGVVELLDVSGGGDKTGVAVHGSGTATADELRVRQIVRNLLQNARRYGGNTIRAEIAGNGESCAIRVIDDGSGVPGGRIDEIFEPHMRAHSSNGNADSLGLGLYVSRTLAMLMGGCLTYGREKDETVFTLRLPAYDPAQS